jgi:hypothetical protein
VVSITSALARFRAKQAEQFTQTGRIDRPTGEPAYDPNTRQSAQPVTTITTKPCKVTSGGTQGNDTDVGETTARIVGHEIKFPVGTDLQYLDIVTILSSKFDPSDVGRQYRVLDVDRREWQISRLARIEETVVPLLNEDS